MPLLPNCLLFLSLSLSLSLSFSFSLSLSLSLYVCLRTHTARTHTQADIISSFAVLVAHACHQHQQDTSSDSHQPDDVKLSKLSKLCRACWQACWQAQPRSHTENTEHTEHTEHTQLAEDLLATALSSLPDACAERGTLAVVRAWLGDMVSGAHDDNCWPISVREGACARLVGHLSKHCVSTGNVSPIWSFGHERVYFGERQRRETGVNRDGQLV